MLRLAATVSLLPLCCFAGESNTIMSVKQDLVGKTLELKQPVAGFSCIYSGTLSFPQVRFVDTEIAYDAEPRYYLRADRLFNVAECQAPRGRAQTTAGQYIETRLISRMYEPGQRMTVKGINAKSDRVEIQLEPEAIRAGEPNYAKLKLMFGNSGDKRSAEEIEMLAGSVLKIPRIETLISVSRKCDALKRSIASLESSLSNTSDLLLKAKNAQALVGQYDQLSAAQRQLDAVAFHQVPDIDHSARKAELQALSSDAERQYAANLVSSASAKYQQSVGILKESCSRLTTPKIHSLQALGTFEVLTNDVRARLDEFEQDRKRMQDLSQPVPEGDFRLFSQCTGLLKQAISALGEQKEQLEREQTRRTLDRLRADFETLRKRKELLQSQFIQSFGTGQQDQAHSDLRKQLELMLDNRRQAAGLGDNSAAQDIAALESEIARLR